MTDRALAIATLVEGYGMKLQNLPQSRIALLDRAFEKIPPALLMATVDRLIHTTEARYGDIPQTAVILRGMRSWVIAAQINWSRLKDLARAVERREELNLIDLGEGWP